MTRLSRGNSLSRSTGMPLRRRNFNVRSGACVVVMLLGLIHDACVSSTQLAADEAKKQACAQRVTLLDQLRRRYNPVEDWAERSGLDSVVGSPFSLRVKDALLSEPRRPLLILDARIEDVDRVDNVDYVVVNGNWPISPARFALG